MGVKLELNTFLVISTNEYYDLSGGDRFKPGMTARCNKFGHRIYPLGMEIPLIVKDTGCQGMAKVKSLKLDQDNITEVEYVISQTFDHDDAYANSLYKSYARAKKDDLSNMLRK
ncbi:MAG TPA: hypothetical protein DD435_17435 [Cyanobacteria bacterium UBA8530]|nr:hypothetical protein [Cyanobacteria bacterium UBA8530]